ncbi:MAG: hypothetical protein FPO08_14130 [Geobacter sp.]|nr:MAG: hypothetical protein FPO08_14130 [Geobacter sp.]
MAIAVLAPQPENAGQLLSRAARALYAVLEDGAVMKDVAHAEVGSTGHAGDVQLHPHRLLWAEKQ